jgi:hypothetical protein
MNKTLLYVGALALSCSTLLAQQTSSSSIIDNNVLFDVTFDSTTVKDQSSYHLEGQQKGVSLSNGKASFYQLPNSSINYGMPSHLNNEGDFTISLWYNGGSEAQGDYELLFQKGDIKISLYDINTPLISSLGNSIWDNSWNRNAFNFGTKKYNIGYSYSDKQHLVVTKKSDSLYFYRNNELKGKSKYVADPTTNNVIKIGDNFSGQIDRVTIYNGVLIHSEIETAFYYNPNTPVPTACEDNLFIEPINLIRGEGNVLYSCGYEDDIYSDKNMFSLLSKTNYGKIEGTAYLTYPNGTVAIRDFAQSAQTFKLTEYGNYVLRFVKTDNCAIEKEFLFSSSPKKPSINVIYPNTNILCNDEKVLINYYIGNPYVKKDINGFEIFSDNHLTTMEQPSIDIQFETDHEIKTILVDKPGTYKLTVDYGTCQVDYSSHTIDVLKCKDDILGITTETIAEFSAYPNPTNSNLTLNADVNGEFEMNSALGESFNIKIENGNVKMEHLPQGVYFLKVKAKTVKIIKN